MYNCEASLKIYHQSCNRRGVKIHWKEKPGKDPGEFSERNFRRGNSIRFRNEISRDKWRLCTGRKDRLTTNVFLEIPRIFQSGACNLELRSF